MGLRVRPDEYEAKKGPYTELALTALQLEVPYRGATELKVLLNGLPVTLALEINSGTVVGLKVTVTLERANAEAGIAIMLRPEVSTDRDGKARGINVEVQTGDTAFDDAVYIDSDASDADTRRILAKPGVRAAVMGVLTTAGCDGLKITGAELTTSFKTPIFDRGVAVPVLNQLVLIASSGGPRIKGVTRHGHRVQLLSFLGVVASAVFAFQCLTGWDYSWALVLIGAASQFVTAIALRPALIRLMAGDSGSYARYRSTFAMQAIAWLLFGAGGAVYLNAKLDRSTPTQQVGKVWSVGTFDDENNSVSVDVAWPDDTYSSMSVRDTMRGSIAVGREVTRWQSRGAFRFKWSTLPQVTGH